MAEHPTEDTVRPSLSDAINALMADPTVLQGAFEALKKSGIGAPTATEPTQGSSEVNEEKEEVKASSLPSSDAGELIRTLSPMLSMLSSRPNPQSGGGKDADRRAALLIALRPYLSESRQEAIDHIVKISQVSDLIKRSTKS